MKCDNAHIHSYFTSLVPDTETSVHTLMVEWRKNFNIHDRMNEQSEWTVSFDLIYDHLSAHSLLVKLGRLGWLMRMRYVWKKIHQKIHKTLDTSKRLHRRKTRSTGGAGKGIGSELCHYWELQTRKRAGSSFAGGSWEGVKSIPRGTAYHVTVGCRRPKDCFVW